MGQGQQPAFPEEKRYALLHEIVRYCASQHLLECYPTHECRLHEIAGMLDAVPALCVHASASACAPQPL